MNRNEVEIIIDKTVQTLKKTHPELIKDINLDEFRSHALALCYQESKFNEKAKNPNSTAKGLFQMLDGTRRDVESRILKAGTNTDANDIWIPEYQAFLAMGYFAYQYKRYGNNWQKAIIAYNLGSWKNQKTTAYLNTHIKFLNELFPDGTSWVNEYASNEIVFKMGFK